MHQLQEIDCSGNDLTSLDVTQCTLLKQLYCNNNQIQRLNLDGCTQLETLNCQYNNLMTYTLTARPSSRTCISITTSSCKRSIALTMR